MVLSTGYEWILLGNICEFREKSIRKSSFKNESGYYNFYTPSGINKCVVADYNEESLIISSNVETIYIDNLFSCSNNNYIITTPYNLYIYYFLTGKNELLNSCYRGRGMIKNLSKNSLKNLQIPIPTNPEKIQQWTNLISQPYNVKNEKQKEIKELEKEIKNRMIEIIYNQPYDELQLGSIATIGCGNYLSREITIEGDYDVYNGMNSSFTYITYNVEANSLIITKYIDSYNCVKLISERCYITNNCYSLNVSNNIIKKYVYYYLLFNKERIYNLASGCIKKVLLERDLANLIIRIPKMLFILELELKFEILESLQEELNSAEQLYNQYIKQLCDEAIPPN